MKRILYLVTQSEFGGAQRYCLDLADGLKNEFDVSIAAGGDGELAKRCGNSGIRYFELKNLKREISPVSDFLAILEIVKLIKELKPDIIHLNSSKISILGSTAAFIANRKSSIIYTCHGWVFNEPLPFYLKLFYKYAEKFTSIFKNRIICVSEFDRETALKNKISPKGKLVAIHNGIKPIDFYSKEEARKILNLPQDKFTVGSIGNLYKTKGYEYLINAFQILITNYKLPIALIIIGEGDERKNLENSINHLKLQKNIKLLGGVENAARLLPAFDAYACSSVKEGLSYTLIEAMRAGLPIVATDAGGNRELIINNKTGLIAQAANANNLAEKLQIIIRDQNLRSNLGQSANIAAQNKFSFESMVKNTREAYLDINGE